jgi:hypothetical protein
MIWLFLTAILLLVVYHRTFRRVVGWLVLVAVVAGAGVYVAETFWWQPARRAQPALALPDPPAPLTPSERAALEERLRQVKARLKELQETDGR